MTACTCLWLFLGGALAASCDDGFENQDEEGIDCGGACPNTCAGPWRPLEALPDVCSDSSTPASFMTPAEGHAPAVVGSLWISGQTTPEMIKHVTTICDVIYFEDIVPGTELFLPQLKFLNSATINVNYSKVSMPNLKRVRIDLKILELPNDDYRFVKSSLQELDLTSLQWVGMQLIIKGHSLLSQPLIKFENIRGAFLMDLSNNGFTGEIPDLSSNIHLEHLNLRGNQLVHTSGPSLDLSARMPPSLLAYDLSQNNLGSVTLEGSPGAKLIAMLGNQTTPFLCPFPPHFGDDIALSKDACSMDLTPLYIAPAVTLVLLLLKLAYGIHKHKKKSKVAVEPTKEDGVLENAETKDVPAKKKGFVEPTEEVGVLENTETKDVPAKKKGLSKAQKVKVLMCGVGWCFGILDYSTDIQFSMDMLAYTEFDIGDRCEALDKGGLAFSVLRSTVPPYSCDPEEMTLQSSKDRFILLCESVEGCHHVISEYGDDKDCQCEAGEPHGFTHDTGDEDEGQACVQCKKNPAATRKIGLTGFITTVYALLGLLGLKGLIDLGLSIYCLTLDDTPNALRMVMGKSVFAPLLLFRRGFGEWVLEIAVHNPSFKSALLLSVLDGLLENVPQIAVSMYFTLVVTGEGVNTLGMFSMCSTLISLVNLLFIWVAPIFIPPQADQDAPSSVAQVIGSNLT